ncbi:MAG: GntR family transcriptional regulator [Cellulosilyticaceae bacterium]
MEDSIITFKHNVHSYTDSILHQGMNPSRKVIHQAVDKPTMKRANKLNITLDDTIFILERVYYANEEPVCVTTAALPYKFFPHIEDHDFSNNSLYEVLENTYDLTITRSNQMIEAVGASRDIAKYLDVTPGHPLLLFRTTTYGNVDGDEVAFECFKSYFKTDKIKYFPNR